jgi:hypothetical protein
MSGIGLKGMEIVASLILSGMHGSAVVQELLGGESCKTLSSVTALHCLMRHPNIPWQIRKSSHVGPCPGHVGTGPLWAWRQAQPCLPFFATLAHR